MTNLKLLLAKILINIGVKMLPKESRTQTTINNMMLTRMISGVTLDKDKK